MESDSVRYLLAQGAPRKLSLEGLWSYLAYGCVYSPWTLVDGVLEVPDRAAPDFNVGQWSLDAAQDAVARAFDKAVFRTSRKRKQTAAASSVAPAFLSGGIDSSAIVASLRRQFPDEEIRTYCVVHEDTLTDERKWARMVADANHTRHAELMLTGDMMQHDLKRMLSDYDQPSIDGVNFWFACKLAAEAGESEILSGEGGDELFAGYGRFSKPRQMYSVKSKLAFLEHIGGLARFAGGVVERLAPDEKFRKLGQVIGSSVDPYYLSRRIFSDNVILSLLSEDVKDAIADRNRNVGCVSAFPANWLVEVEPVPCKDDMINRISWLEMQTSVRCMYLRDGYQVSRPHDLDVRSPFLDSELIELLYTIPGAFKCDSEILKPLLVHAAGTGLPKECVTRKKQGFSLPFDMYFKAALKDDLERFFNEGESMLFKSAVLSRLWSGYQSGKVSWSRVWSLFVVENWCAINGVGL